MVGPQFFFLFERHRGHVVNLFVDMWCCVHSSGLRDANEMYPFALTRNCLQPFHSSTVCWTATAIITSDVARTTRCDTDGILLCSSISYFSSLSAGCNITVAALALVPPHTHP